MVRLEERPDDFARVRGQIAMGRSEMPFIHFESTSDAHWSQKFLKLWRNHPIWFEKINLSKNKFNSVRPVYTKQKTKAIAAHNSAISDGLNVSTLVDMDHDVKDADIREAGDAMFSTFPACTLPTLQFLDDDGYRLNEEELLRVVKDIGQLDAATAQDAINHALKATKERLYRANNYCIKRFTKLGITNPLNDHELAAAILSASGKPTGDQERFKVEEMIRANSLQDRNLRAKELFGEMLSALFNDSTSDVRP